MKRTYFVPMCVLAGFFLLSGATGFVLSGVLENLLIQTDEIFVSEYQAASHEALYAKALELRRELSIEKRDGAFQSSAMGLSLGLLLLWWALDRRRLVRKCAPPISPETKASS